MSCHPINVKIKSNKIGKIMFVNYHRLFAKEITHQNVLFYK